MRTDRIPSVAMALGVRENTSRPELEGRSLALCPVCGEVWHRVQDSDHRGVWTEYLPDMPRYGLARKVCDNCGRVT